MNKFYVIQWKSKVNGRAGRGTKQFEKAEADQLVAELNREYPQIVHEIAEVEPEHREVEDQPAQIPSTTLMLSVA